MYTPIHTERLYQRILDQIQHRVLSGALKVGDQLPPERELADQFMVSRTAVREAIKALREIGLVEILPGRGTFITNGAMRAVRDSLEFLVRMAGQRCEDLVEVREIFEPETAALAALRATPANLRALHEAVNMMEAALDDADRFVEADLDFHLALAAATQNAILPLLIDSIVEVLREQRRRLALAQGGMVRGQQHHRRILEAIERRDPDAAREAMRQHVHPI